MIIFSLHPFHISKIDNRFYMFDYLLCFDKKSVMMEVSGLMVHVVSSRIMVGASSVASDISGDDAVELLMNARITIVHRSS